MPSLVAYGGLRPVAGINGRVIRQDHQLALNTVDEDLVAASGEVAAADAEIEQRIADEHHPVAVETDAAGAVTWCMEHGEFEVAEFDHVAILQNDIWVGRRLHRAAHHEADHARRPRRPFAAGLIPMHRERGARRLFYVAERHQVVRVTMRCNDYLNIQI